MTIDTSGPAFPAPDASEWDFGNRGNYPGMTYRQWLVGLAMQGSLSTEEFYRAGPPLVHAAQRWCEVADAAIRAEGETREEK